jgi:hypothetical protein
MRAADRPKFGQAGIRRINHRMNNGATATEARVAEHKFRRNATLAIAGGLVAARVLSVYGPVANQKVAKRAETKRGENTIAATLKRNETLKGKQNRSGIYNVTTKK